MKRPAQIFAIAVVAASAILVTACSTIGGRPLGRKLKPGEDSFFTTVKPLFERRCVWCHSDRGANAGLNLQDRSATLDPKFLFIVPGDPASSRIYRAVDLEAAHPRVMPGDGWGITPSQKKAMKEWISKGAPWPEDRSGRIRRKRYQVDHDDYM